MSHWRRNLERLARDERGAVSTEYVVLVGTVGLAVMFAIVAVGPTLVHSYERTRDMIAAPFP
jgi:Flp pilus assembly pilin Flp